MFDQKGTFLYSDPEFWWNFVWKIEKKCECIGLILNPIIRREDGMNLRNVFCILPWEYVYLPSWQLYLYITVMYSDRSDGIMYLIL